MEVVGSLERRQRWQFGQIFPFDVGQSQNFQLDSPSGRNH